MYKNIREPTPINKKIKNKILKQITLKSNLYDSHEHNPRIFLSGYTILILKCFYSPSWFHQQS